MKSILFISFTLIFLSCQQSVVDEPTVKNPDALVTFIELGSDKCVPCLQMRPIMKSLEAKYGTEQLKVIFIDVYKQYAEAQKYNILVIPSQIFFDKSGKEFHRHEGFYPEVEIDSLLQKQGLKIIN
jgi:thioredoxin 1